MIDFSTLQGLTIPEGAVTQIADASGRVIWSAVKEVGSLILRPSADISVDHFLYPNDGTAAYLLINEEVSDGSSTYIYAGSSTSLSGIYNSTSIFKLDDVAQLSGKGFTVTSVNVVGTGYSPTGDGNGQVYRNDFKLEINGKETAIVTTDAGKGTFDISMLDAALMINEAVATTGMFPNINISVTSHMHAYVNSSGKDSTAKSGVTQLYVVIGYEYY